MRRLLTASSQIFGKRVESTSMLLIGAGLTGMALSVSVLPNFTTDWYFPWFLCTSLLGVGIGFRVRSMR